MAANLKLHQLRAFVDVARQGSIRAASRLSGLSQPALTKAIQELELALGARLFERRQQGVMLTDVGETFFVMPVWCWRNCAWRRRISSSGSVWLAAK